MPKVSIIMPVYNKAEFLKRTLDAIVSQKYFDWELIIVNDGSTDGSEEIIKQYIKKESRIFYISQDNKGVSAARNTGISKAKGEWIWFVDADDLPDLQFLQLVFGDTKYKGRNIVVGFYECLDQCGKERSVNIDETGDIPVDEIPNIFMKYQYDTGFWGYLWNKLIKREWLMKKNILFQEGVGLAEDLQFMVKLYRLEPKIVVVPYYAMKYTENLSHTLEEKKVDYFAQFNIQMEIKEWIIDDKQMEKYIPFFKKIISYYVAFVIFYAYEEKDNYKEAAKILMSNLEVKNQLCVNNIKGSMRVIVWCMKKDKIFLLNMYLKLRNSIKKLYRWMKGK